MEVIDSSFSAAFEVSEETTFFAADWASVNTKLKNSFEQVAGC